MKPSTPKTQRCAIYTRVSTDQGLEQEFNSLHAQREAASAYVKSQAHEGWRLIRDHYDDGGFSGGSMERPALQNCRRPPNRDSTARKRPTPLSIPFDRKSLATPPL